ncbi:membrane protein [Bryobacterales bacterium F-183]|nr:membrane protein [Bryobacterales bacterium F-183]
MAAFGAIVVAFAIYSPSLSGQFVYDDLNLPFLNDRYARLPFSAWIAGVRPMLMASYWVNFQIGGLDTTSYHVFNVLFHALNAVLVGLAVRKLAGGNEAWLGLLAGALFVAHPLNTEAVSYVASRSENLTVLLFLGAFVAFLYRRSREIDWGTAAVVLVLFGMACLSKEYAVTLPVLLLLTDLYFNEAGPKSNWRVYAPVALGALAGVYFVWGVLTKSTTAGFGLKDLSASDYFFTQCRAIWVYVLKFFVPVGLNVDYDFAISRSLMDHGAVIGLVALVAVSGAAFWFRKEFPLASYGWFVFLLLLAPTSSFVPIADVLVERRAYLPSFGLLLIVAEIARRVPVQRLAWVVPVAVFAVLTFGRNQLWADPIALWKDAAEKSPKKWRVQFQVADALYRNGDCAQAAAAFEQTSKLDKPDYRVLINWAHALDCSGQAEPALAKAQEALQLEQTGQAYAFVGMQHAKAKRYDEALTALNQAIAKDPNFDPAYAYRGNVYALQGDMERAAADYKRAVELNPSNDMAARGLARANRR